MWCESKLNIKIIRKNSFSLNPKTPSPQIWYLEGCFVIDSNKTAKIMCCIDCRNQKLVLNPTKIFYVEGNQENRHRCATLADIFPDSETGGLMTLNAYYSIICLKNSGNFAPFDEK